MTEPPGRQIRIPGFRDFVEIGRGGFAVVYKAQQDVFQREVAVKIVTVLDVSDEARRRFRRECTAIGRLAWHPHIVSVFDAGDTPEGWPYLVMEYLPAGSLGDQITRSGALAWSDVVAIGIKVAGALQAAHDEGSLHRDVKPDNVLVNRLGEPMLADFGIATLQDGTRSRSGMVTATLVYAAPEVLAGQRATVASDVYALGATLHALLTGKPPFTRDTDENVFAIMRRIDAEPADDLRPLGVPGPVASAIEQAMAKAPVDRPPTAAAFATLLTEAALGAGHSAHRAPPAPTPAPAPAPTPPLIPVPAAFPPPPPPQFVAVPAPTVIPPGAAAPWSPPPVPAAPVPPAPVPPGRPRGRRRLALIAGATVVVVAAVAIALTVDGGSGGGSDGGASNGGSDPTSEAAQSTGGPDGAAATTIPDPEPGQIITVVGTGTSGDSGPGLAPVTLLDNPWAIAIGSDGNINIANTGRNVILIVDKGAFVSTVAPASGQTLDAPRGITVGPGGSVLYADTNHHQIGRIDADGSITTVAGSSTGDGDYAGDDGPAIEAQLNAPHGLATASDGALFVADTLNDVIRRIDPLGTITTIAGTGEAGLSGDDGPATAAQLNAPVGVAVGPDGAIYVADTDNHRIRRISLDGTITTIAGTGSEGGYTGDGGDAVDAQLDGPSGVAVGLDGTIYVADTFNDVIRRISVDGIITTIAGTGEPGDSGDGGHAGEAQLDGPRGVAVGPDGDIYVADTNNHKIRRIDVDASAADIAAVGEANTSQNPAPPPPPPVAAPPVSTEIKDFAFSDLTVPVATKITWVNQDSAVHTVTSDTGQFDSGVGSPLSNGDTFSLSFDTSGSFGYHCEIHPSMKATITVT